MTGNRKLYENRSMVHYLLELCSSGVELIALAFNAIEVAFHNRGWLELQLE